MSLATTLLEGYIGYSSIETEAINDPIGYMNDACIECITGLYEASQQFYTGDIIGQTQVLMEGTDPKQKIKELWEGFKKKMSEILAKFIDKLRKVTSFFKKKATDKQVRFDKILKVINSIDSSSNVTMLDIIEQYNQLDKVSLDLFFKLNDTDILDKVRASDIAEDVTFTISEFIKYREGQQSVVIQPDDVRHESWRDVFVEKYGSTFDIYKTQIDEIRASFNKITQTVEVSAPTLKTMVNTVKGTYKYDTEFIQMLTSAISNLTSLKKDLNKSDFLEGLDNTEQTVIAMLQRRIMASLDFYNQSLSIQNIRIGAVDMLLTQIEIGLRQATNNK